jgi:hypothetical protein
VDWFVQFAVEGIAEMPTCPPRRQGNRLPAMVRHRQEQANLMSRQKTERFPELE